MLPRSELVIMGRVRGLHPGSSKDVVKCPVDSCSKVKVRRDNWVKHIQTVGTSKTQAKKKAFKVIYERIRHEGFLGVTIWRFSAFPS